MSMKQLQLFKTTFPIVILALMFTMSTSNQVRAIPDNPYIVEQVRDIPPNPYDTKELLRLWNESLIFDYESYLLWDVLKDNPDPLFGLDL